jgi:pimeloyl-ACP methyl ester carboxylesterase
VSRGTTRRTSHGDTAPTSHLRRRASAWLALGFAQSRVPVGIAAAYDGPVLGKLARGVAGRVREEETTFGGVPAIVFRPGRGAGPWPAVVLFPGVTRQGRRHPAFLGIGRGLAAAGRLAIVAEPEGMSVGELTPMATTQARRAVEAALSRPDAAQDAVSLVGVSGGGTLALRTAADPCFVGRVSIVLALAPLCDVSEAIRIVTTGVYTDGDALVPFSAGDFFKLVIARSVVACMPSGEDRAVLRSRLLSLDDYGPDPLSCLREWPRDGLGDSARATVELLSNEHPHRFDDLLAALPEELGAAIDAISPISVAHRIAAPVELVVAREDTYITLADATSFAEACTSARLTVLGSLTHAVPQLSPTAVRDLARLDGVLVRLLAAYSRR